MQGQEYTTLFLLMSCELADEASTRSVCKDDEQLFANLLARRITLWIL